MGSPLRPMDTYQSSQNTHSSSSFSSQSSSSAVANGRTPESSTTQYADSKDVVRDSAAPPPYSRYADEEPRQPQPQQQSQAQTPRQRPQPQEQAAQRAYQNTQYQNTQYQNAPPLQAQNQEYRYQMDLPQNYDGNYGYGRVGRHGGPRGRRAAGPLHMLMDNGMSNQQYQSRPDMYAQPKYGYDDMEYGRRGRRNGRRGRGGPLHMLLELGARKL